MRHRPSIAPPPALGQPRGPAVTPAAFAMLRRAVRKAANLPRGVRVTCVLDPAIDPLYNAWCLTRGPMSYEIHVDATATRAHVADLLVHEYAHVRQALYHPGETQAHGAGFGVEFAFVHRRFVGDPLS